jgi:hypothetical protein
VRATAELSIPLPLSESRPGPLSKPRLSLSYSSGSANGILGYGWQLGLDAIQRKQSNRIPTYTDSDVFQLAGEDLVPRLDAGETSRNGYRITSFYRRHESSYDRIERWTSITNPSDTFWKRITGDNVSTVFGDSNLSRISDPTDSAKTVQWLISASWDASGNAILYNYVQEDSVNVDLSSLHESTRRSEDRTANRYLSSVNYGNRVPTRSGKDFIAFHPRELQPEQWMFRVVLDYGDDGPTPDWKCRLDPFSVYSSGFEIRTYRLCQRILMFHNFPNFVKADLPGILVNSMSLAYSQSPRGTFLESATLSGHSPTLGPGGIFTGEYVSKALPPMTFTYSSPSSASAYVAQWADAKAAGTYSASTRGSGQWLDLYGSGIPGLLLKENETLYWRENQSPLNAKVTLTEPHAIHELPGFDDQVQPTLNDIDGRGRPALMTDEGFIAQSQPGQWDEYRSFSQKVQFDTARPQNLVQLDLTGDGLADMLFATDGAFMWSQSLGVEGYGPIQRVAFMGVMEATATLVFGQSEQPSLFLADMSGDGLLDLVNVVNGRIEYFPNLGYGAFGRKISMDNAPWFDDPAHFSSSSIRFVDVDGSGNQDIIYLLRDGGATLYRNFSGNALGPREYIREFPSMTHADRVDTVDLLGKGTGCLVWTSTLPGREGELQYIDLAPSGKPNLMTSFDNGVGLETFMEYVASTKLFLEDRLAGREWATQLAFPIQCLHRVTKYDRVTQTKKTQRFRYRHGFWDMFDREFRGFGFIESWDGEDLPLSNIDSVNAARPVSSLPGGVTHTKAWYHTGLELDQEKVTRYYEREFCLSAKITLPLWNTAGDLGKLAAAELREVHRALAGHSVRQEIYGVGPGESVDIPYSVTENTYTAVVDQTFTASHAPAVVRVDTVQTTNMILEQEASEPRVSHSMNLAYDPWGNILKSVSVSYGLPVLAQNMVLPQAVRDAQSKTSVVMTISRYTNAVDEEEEDFLRPALCEQATYEVQPPADISTQRLLTLGSITAAGWLEFQGSSGIESTNYRLLSKSRSIFRGADMTPLDLGKLDSMGILLTTYKLAFAKGMLNEIYADAKQPLVEQSEALQGGYEDLDDDGQLWISNGRQLYANLGSSPQEELSSARASFFSAVSFLDVFGTANTISFDQDHLCVLASADAVGNTASCVVDYRVLKPWKMTDINNIVSEVAFDTLGNPVATALLGPSSSSNDFLNSLDGIVIELNEETTSSFLSKPTTESALELLQAASSRAVYSFSPNGVVQGMITREQDAVLDKTYRVQIVIKYASGIGTDIQTKTLYSEEGGSTWLTTGWTISEHRGSVVKKFEPFFDDSSLLNPNINTVCTETVLIDALGRSVVLLGANGLWSKMERHAWSATSMDVGDLVEEDLFANSVLATQLQQLGSTSTVSWKSRASQAAILKSGVYSNTPNRTYMDPAGRQICMEYQNSDATSLFSFNEIDIQGRLRALFDETGRTVARYDYNMVGRCCKQTLMDTGTSWSFFDATGAPQINRTARRAILVTEYDILRRPTKKTVAEAPEAAPRVVERIIYGDTTELSVPPGSNLKGKVYKTFDEAGIAVNEAYGPRGEQLSSTRQYTVGFKGLTDWSDLKGPGLNPNIYRSLRTFDALNRQRSYLAPDGSTQRSEYSQGGHLQVLTVFSDGQDEVGADAVITKTTYNARGQQTLIQYGNRVTTIREYDELSFWCTRLNSVDSTGQVLQDLNYDFDCMGKIISITDNSKQDAFFKNNTVAHRSEYTYDYRGRLISATGREQLGRKGETSPTLVARSKSSLGLDPGAMTTYTETYKYDDVGNMLQMTHGSGLSSASWTMNFTHAESSLLEPNKNGNRLSSTAIGASTELYGYGGEHGSNGCMTKSKLICATFAPKKTDEMFYSAGLFARCL